MNLAIVKIGGSVITDKKSLTPKINSKNLKIIAGQLKNFKLPYILIHGAGSFGHPIVKKSGIDKGIKNKSHLIAFAETQRLQNRLNCLVCDFLIKQEIPAVPCQASSHAIMKKGRLVKMEFKAIENMVKLKMVPVLYGVPAYDEAQGCSILSGDQIAPYLALKLKADKIIEAGDVEGVCTCDPKKNKEAKLIEKINKKNFNEIIRYLSGSQTIDVTGGMKQKYLELADTAKKGIITQIVHFKRLEAALDGQEAGTTINFKE
ncbi:MAG: isopentenyl phosphate kinase [Candidatus Pacebacteria bacterium]|nr:isopentenyl phosphate kinase [Candidatus Paceibacterota bacterium]MDD4874789.1 isopentenyl phosphate kinase [Candidatus Paceibacterota bacterium]